MVEVPSDMGASILINVGSVLIKSLSKRVLRLSNILCMGTFLALQEINNVRGLTGVVLPNVKVFPSITTFERVSL